MLRLRLFGCALLFHTSVVAAQELPRVEPEVAGFSRTALRKIDDQLQRWVDSGKVAGIVAVIARDGKIAYTSAAGSLDSARQAPIAPDAVYRLFSMSKPIASTAIMQLVERGRIKLDDPVSKYIPAFANAKVYAGGGSMHPILQNPARPITIAHLLTHTAGLTYGAFGNTPVDSIYTRSALMDPHLTLAVFADSIARLPLMFDPGSAFNYSFAIDVLGRVVEVATGQT